MQKIEVSVIIPFPAWNEKVAQCVQHCALLAFDSYEMILLPDFVTSQITIPQGLPCRIIETGAILPGAKRNIGSAVARGEILAFIDADAYPDRHWLDAAVVYFTIPSVSVVGGVNLPPRSSTDKQWAAWEILASPLLSGSLSQRYFVKRIEERLEVQSSNMCIRSAVFHALGGFREDILTAEDTELCFRIINSGGTIIQVPDAVVYHELRAVVMPFWKQISHYAQDQGRVIGTLPLKNTLIWWVPTSSVAIMLGFALLSFMDSHFFSLFCIIASLSMVWIALASALAGPVKRWPWRFITALGVYPIYGIQFIKGFCSAWGAHKVSGNEHRNSTISGRIKGNPR